MAIQNREMAMQVREVQKLKHKLEHAERKRDTVVRIGFGKLRG
jgi:hypothetical protein